MGFVYALGKFKREALLQPGKLFLRKNGENLIGRGGNVQAIARLQDPCLEPLRLEIGVARQLQPEVVF